MPCGFPFQSGAEGDGAIDFCPLAKAGGMNRQCQGWLAARGITQLAQAQRGKMGIRCQPPSERSETVQPLPGRGEAAPLGMTRNMAAGRPPLKDRGAGVPAHRNAAGLSTEILRQHRARIVTRMGVRRCGAKKKECSNDLSLLA